MKMLLKNTKEEKMHLQDLLKRNPPICGPMRFKPVLPGVKYSQMTS